MIKTLIKMFIPNEKKLAQMAADSLAKAVNSSGKNDLIEKYAGIANDITSVQAMVTRILTDGKVDQSEIEEISARLEPLFKYLLGMI